MERLHPWSGPGGPVHVVPVSTALLGEPDVENIAARHDPAPLRHLIACVFLRLQGSSLTNQYGLGTRRGCSAVARLNSLRILLCLPRLPRPPGTRSSL